MRKSDLFVALKLKENDFYAELLQSGSRAVDAVFYFRFCCGNK